MSVSLITPVVRMPAKRRPVRSVLTRELRDRQAGADDNGTTAIMEFDETTAKRRASLDAFLVESPFMSAPARRDCVETIAESATRADFDAKLAKCQAIADDYRAAGLDRGDDKTRKDAMQAALLASGLKAGVRGDGATQKDIDRSIRGTAAKMAKYSVICREIGFIANHPAESHYFRDSLTSLVKWHDDSNDWRLVVGTKSAARPFNSADAEIVSACFNEAMSLPIKATERKATFVAYLRANGILPASDASTEVDSGVPSSDEIVSMVRLFIANNPAKTRDELLGEILKAAKGVLTLSDVDSAPVDADAELQTASA